MGDKFNPIRAYAISVLIKTLESQRCSERGFSSVIFCRTLGGDTLRLCESIQETCDEIQLKDEPDYIRWTLFFGKISVDMMYRKLIDDNIKSPHKLVVENKNALENQSVWCSLF